MSLIPSITDERLQGLSKKIRPVVLVEDKGLYYIDCVDPRSTSCIHDPKIVEEADGLLPIRDIFTLHVHPVAAYGGVNPKVAEVLAQVPEDIIDDILAFEISERCS